MLVFGLAFCSYMWLHAVRKALSNVKGELLQFGCSKDLLGFLDTIWLCSYAGMLMMSGLLIERFGVIRVLVASQIATATFAVLFGLVGLANVGSESASVLLVLLWAANGLAQGVAWPCEIQLLCNWFGSKRGALLGVFSMCGTAGNVVGGLLASALLKFDLGWPPVFIVPGVLVGVWGVLMHFQVTSHPEGAASAPASMPEEKQAVARRHSVSLEAAVPAKLPHTPLSLRASNPAGVAPEPIQDEDSAAREPTTFVEVFFFVPGVVNFCVACALSKLIAYALMFWLPLYVSESLHRSESMSDLIATLWDVGGAAGSVVWGQASDVVVERGFPRTMLIAPVLVMSGASLIAFLLLGDVSLFATCSLILLCGFLGNFNMINGAVCSDLSKKHKRVALITGVVDGTGTFGAAALSLLVTKLVGEDWSRVFYLLTTCSVLAAVAVATAARSK
jgi:sugar phosphate permease